MSVSAHLDGRVGAFALDIALDVPEHGVTALVGRSGSGKTTLLRCLAGLARLPGRITVDGEVWQDGRRFVPAHRRGIGYIMQGAPLLPHLTLRQSLAYAERRRALAMPVDEAVARTGSAALLDRATGTLSGGERQRAALALALVAAARLLLLDEPLSALDAQSREEQRAMLGNLLPTLPITTFLVSHDPHEVEHLAARQVAIAAGRVQWGAR